MNSAVQRFTEHAYRKATSITKASLGPLGPLLNDERRPIGPAFDDVR